MGIDTSQTRRIGPNYIKFGGMAAVMLVSAFLFFNIEPEQSGSSTNQVLFWLVAFMFLCSGLFSIGILAGSTYIVLTPFDFTIAQLGRKTILLWDEVDYFFFEESSATYGASWITYTYSEIYFQRHPDAQRKQFQGKFMHFYGISLERLEATLNAYKERYAPRDTENE